MLSELVAFTLQCTLPSSTPITISLSQPLTTCAAVLAGPPPSRPNPCETVRNCFYSANERASYRYESWQQYCDAQTIRPCEYDGRIKALSGWMTHCHGSNCGN